MTDQQSLKILYLSAEVVPFAKTGGLADVAGALPKAIRCSGPRHPGGDAALWPRGDREVRPGSPPGRARGADGRADGDRRPPRGQHRRRAGRDAGLLRGQPALLRPPGHLHVPGRRRALHLLLARRAGDVPRARLAARRDPLQRVAHGAGPQLAARPSTATTRSSPAPRPSTRRTTWSTRASSAIACSRSPAWPISASSPIPTWRPI